MSEQPSTEAAAQSPAARSSLFDRWFKPVRVPHEAPRELADLARRGSVVFVMRSAGLLNFLYLAWFLRQLGLPPLRTALGLSGIMPWLARARVGAADLAASVRAGEAAVVFLRRANAPDPFTLLAGLQRETGRPIFLVPALLFWTRRPQKLKPSVGEVLFGTPDRPSRLANFLGFVANHRRAVLRLGRPSDLAAFAAERAGEPDALLARKARGALHHHLARQVRAVVGPPLKSAARMREQVLRDHALREALAAEARRTGRPAAELEAEAAACVREIASRYNPAFIEVARALLGWFFGSRYDAVDVDEEGMARVKRAASDTPIVLCPSHKSYVDFLVLSWVFYEQGMTPPHIAAGINLAFWPFGAIARRGGAFFIRRSMKGDRVYTAVLRAYVKQLLREKFPQEFYVEGGRSRSGKLLSPKTGLVSMEVDAWLDGATDDVLFVPVAIDYERLIEGRSHAHELAGGEKTKEDLRGLLRARKALGRRYGRLTVQFDEPISLRAFAAERLGERARALTLDEDSADPAPPARGADAPAEAKRSMVQALANRIAYGINRATTVTPDGLLATALLAHVRRGLPAEEVARRVELLRYVAADRGARFARGLAGSPSDPRRPGPLAAAVARFEEEGLLRVERIAGETIYQPVEERRALLDYYKNAVLHRYVPLALVAGALRASGGDGTVAEVKERTRWLSRLFKLEFMYRVGTTFDDLFAETVAFLSRLGVLVSQGDRLHVGRERQTLHFFADLLRPYLEAYRATAEALLHADPAAAADPRALARAALEHARASYAAGRLELRESVSKATIENAVAWLLQQGGAAGDGDAAATIDPGWRSGTLPEVVREIARHLAS